MKSAVTTLGEVRSFPGWGQDWLGLDDTTSVIVHVDGSVNCANTGDLLCEGGFGYGTSAENAVVEWKQFWGFL